MNRNDYPNQPILVNLAYHAGEIMRNAFAPGTAMDRNWKEDNTPVTESDKRVNDTVVGWFGRHFPYISVVGEEGSRIVKGAKFVALFDPIDGTIPFCSGIPVSTFCLSILENWEPISAVIYDPFCDRVWCAEKGRGCYRNTMRVDVSKHTECEQALVSTVWWDNAPFNLGRVCDSLMARKAKWVNLASVAICGGLIASGQLTASIFPGSKAWETAAMQLIVEEAGGRATDLYGKPLKYGLDRKIAGHIVSNGAIHDELVEMVRTANLNVVP